MSTNQTPAAEPESTDVILAPAMSILERAKAGVVDCPEMLQVAADELGEIKAKARQLTEERMSLTRPLDDTKARIIAKYAKPLDYLAKAELAWKGHIAVYNAEMARERAEAQRKADEAARAVREAAERAAAAALAKSEAEAKALREKAAAAAAAGNAGAAAAADLKASQVEDRGAAKAAILTEQALNQPTSVVVPDAPSAKGVHMVKRYSGEVLDKAALVAFVAQNPMFLHLLDVNQPAIDAQARALKDLFAIAGCRVVVTSTVAARAR